MDFIVSNWPVIVGIATGVLAVAAIVVKLTATPVDDAVVGFLQKGLALLSGLFGQKAAPKVEPLVEQKPEEEPLLKERKKTRLP